LATVLRLLHRSIFCHLKLRMDLLDEESDDLGLVDVSVVGIDLDEGLYEGLGRLGDPLAVDALHRRQEIIPVDHTLVDLLIIFLQLRQHLVHFLFEERLKPIQARLLDQCSDFFHHRWLCVDQL